MNKNLFFAAAFISLMLGGCATRDPSTESPPSTPLVPTQDPYPELFPPSTQLVPKASKHWEMMADEISNHARASLERISGGTSSVVYVVPSPHRSHFSQAFRDLLVTRLVRRGVTVSDHPSGAISLEYQSQLVPNRNASQISSVEVIVNTSLVSNGRYLMRTTDVYYLDKSDAKLYIAAPIRNTPVRDYRVVGGG